MGRGLSCPPLPSCLKVPYPTQHTTPLPFPFPIGHKGSIFPSTHYKITNLSQNQTKPISPICSMDPNNASAAAAHEFLLSSNTCDHDSIIDLGLSLRTLQPDLQANYHHHHHQPAVAVAAAEFEGYGDDNHVMNWAESYVKNSSCCRIMMMQSSSSNIGQEQQCEEDAEVVQSKQQQQQGWGYVKVNMDGVVVGRKVCIFQHGCYSSLALQLQDMFDRQCESGLKLFETESEFSLFYKDGDENWRRVGDVPWKQFVEGVRRLRIARKDDAFVDIHQN